MAAQQQMTASQINTLKAICDAIVEAVGTSGELGVPGGHLYAGLIGVLNLHQFEGIMEALVSIGKVRKQGQLYFAGSVQ
jgi:hypothetical protein